MKRAATVLVGLVLAAAVAAGALWLAQPNGPGPAAEASPTPTASTAAPSTATVPAAASTSASPSTEARDAVCADEARAFEPRSISVPGVTRNAGVVTPPRDADGVPGVPPLTAVGKTVFAWDREQAVRPGDPRGNVLLNAHTWPDGSALGNALLAGLHRGDRIVVRGEDTRLCYRVTERVEVSAEAGLPRYYATTGPPQLAIVVCSGRRLGPGNWENRTVWFASPSA